MPPERIDQVIAPIVPLNRRARKLSHELLQDRRKRALRGAYTTHPMNPATRCGRRATQKDLWIGRGERVGLRSRSKEQLGSLVGTAADVAADEALVALMEERRRAHVAGENTIAKPGSEPFDLLLDGVGTVHGRAVGNMAICPRRVFPAGALVGSASVCWASSTKGGAYRPLAVARSDSTISSSVPPTCTVPARCTSGFVHGIGSDKRSRPSRRRDRIESRGAIGDSARGNGHRRCVRPGGDRVRR